MYQQAYSRQPFAWGEGPSVSAQGFTRPEIFTYGHQVKGKGENTAALKNYLHAAAAGECAAAGFAITKATPLCVVGNKENRSAHFDKSSRFFFFHSLKGVPTR